MAARYRLFRNSIPVAVVYEDELDKYYTQFKCDEARKIEDDKDFSVDDKIEKPPVRMQGIIYVLVVSDYGETCDGHIRKLGAYADRDLAEAMLKDDMEYQLKQNPSLHHIKNNEITNDDYTCGSIYDIIEVEY